MVDVFGRAKRSEIMGSIRGMDTTPEMRVRRLLHALGYRFRLHRRDLPGNPDIVLPRHRKVILVHGCFWHRHPGCPRATIPSTNRGFWKRKLEGNKMRDSRTKRQLRKLGWQVLAVWQCQTRDKIALKRRLVRFLQKKH